MPEYLIEVLFEDNHLIVVNKRPGDIVQGDKTGDKTLAEKVKQYIKEKYQKPGEVFIGVVHRIDRPVSGAVIFARTSKSLTRMTNMFKSHDVHKTYWAIVKNQPPQDEGHLIHYLKKNEAQNKSYVYPADTPETCRAELNYKVIGKSDTYYLLEVELLTGRHHQIRVQLAAIGCPIKGDLKYGFPRSNPGGSISLHSRRIEFIHPVKKEPVVIIAQPPKDAVWDYFCSRQ